MAPPLIAPPLFGNPERAQEQRALRVDFLLFGGLRDVPGQALRQTFSGPAIPQHYESAIQRAVLGERGDAARTVRDSFTDAERKEVGGAVAKVVGELIGDGIPAHSGAFGAGVRSAFDLAFSQVNARRRAGEPQSEPAPSRTTPTSSPTLTPTPAPDARAAAPQAIPTGLSPEQFAVRIGDFLPRAGSNPPAVYGTTGGAEARQDAAAFNRASNAKVAIPLEVEADIGGQKARTWVVYSGIDPASAANLARNVDATSTFTVLNPDALRDAGLSPEGLAARVRRQEDAAFARDLPVIGGQQMSPLMSGHAYVDARSTVRGNNESAVGHGRIDNLDLVVPMQNGRGAFVQGITRGEAISLLDSMQRNGNLRQGVNVNDVVAANGLGSLIGADAQGRAFVRETPQALNAPGETPEVPALPRETGGAEQAERREKSVGEAAERAGRTLEELQRAASQPFSRDLNELVKDKADAMRGQGDGIGALMLEMTHLSKSAPGNAVGANGGTRSAPGISSAALNELRRTDPDVTAAMVNGPLNGKLDRLPGEISDAMRESLQRAAQPSEAIMAALRKLEPKAEAAEGNTQALSPADEASLSRYVDAGTFTRVEFDRMRQLNPDLAPDRLIREFAMEKQGFGSGILVTSARGPARAQPIDGTVVDAGTRPDLADRAKAKLAELVAAMEAPGGTDDPKVVDKGTRASALQSRIEQSPSNVLLLLDESGEIAGVGGFSVSQDARQPEKDGILYADSLVSLAPPGSGVAESLLKDMYARAPKGIMRLVSLNAQLDEHYQKLGGQRLNKIPLPVNVFEWRKPPTSANDTPPITTGDRVSWIADKALIEPLRVLDAGLPANPRDLGIMQYVQGDSFESGRVQRAGQSGVRPVDTSRLALDEPVFPVGQPVTGDFIRLLTSVNGMPVEQLQESMYPDPEKTDLVYRSVTGFLAQGADLRENWAEMNDRVLERGVTSQQLVGVMQYFIDMHSRLGDDTPIGFKGQRYTVQLQHQWANFQQSPFRDNSAGKRDYEITNVDTGESLFLSDLTLRMAENWSYWQKDTPYSVDPIKIIDFFGIEGSARETPAN